VVRLITFAPGGRTLRDCREFYPTPTCFNTLPIPFAPSTGFGSARLKPCADTKPSSSELQVLTTSNSLLIPSANSSFGVIRLRTRYPSLGKS